MTHAMSPRCRIARIHSTWCAVQGRDLSQVMSRYSIISNVQCAQFTEQSDRIAVTRSVIPVSLVNSVVVSI